MRAINLIPRDERASSGLLGRTGAAVYALLGALAVALLAVVVLVVYANRVSDREANLADKQAEASQLSAQASALKPYGDFAAIADARRATVGSLAASRFDWEQALRDTARALPDKVSVASIDGSVAPGAGAAGPLRGAIPQPAIDVSGCTADQGDVAVTISRLRTVRGVTRVSLSKSSKGSDSGSGGAGSGGGGCRGGSPVTFQLTMFFERSKAQLSGSVAPVAVAAPGAAATPPASAQGATP